MEPLLVAAAAVEQITVLAVVAHKVEEMQTCLMEERVALVLS